MRAALIQLTSSDDPIANLDVTRGLIAEAAERGATFVLTPEVTNCVSSSRECQREVLQRQADDITLTGLSRQAADLGISLLIGSLALKGDSDTDDRFVNRSFLIGSNGEIQASYDKIHMFDVTLSETESYRESAGYRPGDKAVAARVGDETLGMTVCYDVRFPHLFRSLAHHGATMISVPSAFAVPTGLAHWQVLLRARAIETGCFILAPAQTGKHAASQGRPRQTWGHSMAIGPWGDVLADAGEDSGVTLIDLDFAQVSEARRRVPSLSHDRGFEVPQ